MTAKAHSTIDSSNSSFAANEPSCGEANTLDIRGEVCPYTFVRTRLALEALPLGSTLTVLCDHEPASRNVPRSATDWGQQVTSVEATGTNLWRIVIEKRVR